MMHPGHVSVGRLRGIKLGRVVILLDYGGEERRETGESYIAAEEHALLSQISTMHWSFSR